MQKLFRHGLRVVLLALVLVLHTSFTVAPIVEWLTGTEHDFGTIVRERPVHFVFRFKNISSEPILLETARTTCGCTAARWTETPIAPGADGKLTIEYDAYQSGSFEKKIRVFFDKQRKAEVLRISGTVE